MIAIRIFRDLILDLGIFSSIFIIGLGIKKRKDYYIKYVLAFFLCFTFRILYTYVLIPNVLEDFRIALNILGTILRFSLTSFVLYFIYNTKIKNLVFISTIGYTFDHISIKLFQLFFRIIFSEMFSSYYSLIFLFLIQILLLFFLYLAHKNSAKYPFEIKTRRVIVLLAIVLSFISFFDYDYMFSLIGSSQKVMIYSCLFAALFSTLILALELTFINDSVSDYKLENARKELSTEYEKRIMQEEVVESLNMKAHDLKHQIYNLDDENYKNELKDLVDKYESLYETGNRVLDIIISEKDKVCKENEIYFSFIVDGKQISFMKESDIYSLFGNILDNAIESCLNISDKSKRIISLKLIRNGYFIKVHEENYFDGKIERNGGSLKTTKNNELGHGFGTRSIVKIVDEYGGSTSFSTRDNLFMLDIIIPL